MHTLSSLRTALRVTSTRATFHRHVIQFKSPSRLCSSHGKIESSANPSKESSETAQDHQTIGKRLNLFSTTPYSAGSPLLHADGSHLFLKLQSLLRAQHQAFGFREVISPTIYKQSLWEKSGHWQNYSDDMFEVVGRGARGDTEGREAGEDEKWGLKPMNCPGHCLLFGTETRSYRDLPVRFADFSPLHRNEISGALSGLTRVRRFHQDDGHIFCRPDQVKQEIASTLKMVNLIYSAFGLRPHKLMLSTRPETSFIGTEAEWEKAESQLQSALNESGLEWELNPGDGAFYGPKIDIILRDSHGKEHQTATIQLDFQLPQRFELEYQTESTSGEQSSQLETPILIHRAVLGSLERFMALLIEHYAGKWPFWLNPRQVNILTLNDSAPVVQHAENVARLLTSGTTMTETQTLRSLDHTQYMVDIDSSAETLGKKLVHARAKGYGIVCFIGNQEVERGDVTVSFLTLDGERSSVKVERLIDRSVPGTSETVGWKRSKKVTLQPELLRQIMGRMCNWWL